MHLVIDMQGAQTGSRFRGIGRLSLALVKAIVRLRGENRVTLAFSGLLPETIGPLRAEFAELLPQESFHVWHGIGPTREVDAENLWRRDVSERLREAALAALQPDAVLITSLFEGYQDNALHSLGLLRATTPTAAIFYDLIPLKSPGAAFAADQQQQSWYARKLEVLKKCNKLLAISEYSRQEAIRELGFQPAQVDTISCGCDAGFRNLGLTEADKAEVRAANGIRKPFVMYTGGGDTSKNLGRLILAFASLAPEVRNRHALVFVGRLEPGDLDKLRAIGAASGMDPQDLHFTGYVPEDALVKLYNACSLFVFPSLHEGFGLPPLEAMACGAPVIASNLTSVPEVVGLDEALFDPLSVESIAGKMHLALSDEGFRGRLIAHGGARAQRFTWEASAARAWKSLLALRAGVHGAVSSRLSVERTGIFAPRRLKILVTKLDHLGDFILSIPAMAKLRARYPDAEIDIVVGSWNVPFAHKLGYFRNVHAFDFFKRKSSSKPSAQDEELSALLASLDAYDMAIDLRRQTETRFLLARTTATLKAGYQTFDDEVDAHLHLMLRAYKEAAHLRTPLNLTPISLQIMRLVDALPANANDYVSLPRIAADGVRQSGRVAIFPKAGTDVREWGPAKFAQLVAQFLDTPAVSEVHIFFVNKAEAAEFSFPVAPRVQVHVGLEFPALTQLLTSASLCIANNSGGIHLASYLGVPVLGIYSGHELAAEWGPQFHGSVAIHRNADCAPCHLGRKVDCQYGNFCLEDIAVEDVYHKSVEALAGASGATASGAQSLPADDVGQQWNENAVVRELITALAPHLADHAAQSWIDVAAAIERNHPGYTALGDSSAAYGNVVNVIHDHRSKYLEWSGFSGPEARFRWSDGLAASVQFYLEAEEVVPAQATLLLLVDTNRRQRISARFNGIHVYEATKSGRQQLLRIAVGNLRQGLNRLELLLPDAASPGSGDPRQLGLAVRKFRIVVEDPAQSGIVRRANRLRAQTVPWL